MIQLEHINISICDAQNTAQLLEQIFEWKIRWQGPSIMGGHSIHVGTDNQYIALYSEGKTTTKLNAQQRLAGGFNHIGVVVDNLAQIEQRVIDAGLMPHSHQDYEPGQRFYFNDSEGVEYEVVSYC